MHRDQFVEDCQLEETPNGWWCPECDPRKQRLLPVNAHRMCGKVIRAQIEQDIAPDITPDTRTIEQIRQTLDKCFGGCRHMKRYCTKRGSKQLPGWPQEQEQAWIEHLLVHDCEPE